MTETNQKQRLLSVAETAVYLGVSPKFIYSGRLPVQPVRLGRLVKYDLLDINKYIEKLKEKRN